MGEADLFRIEIRLKDDMFDSRGQAVLAKIADLDLEGLTSSEAITSVRASELYFLDGALTGAQVRQIAETLLCDAVVQTYHIDELRGAGPPPPKAHYPGAGAIEVGLHPGVTDSVAASLGHGMQRLGLQPQAEYPQPSAAARQPVEIRTAQRYLFTGVVSAATLHRIARELLVNDVIQSYSLAAWMPHFGPLPAWRGPLVYVPLAGVTDEALLQISRDRRLALDLAEMQAIQHYFRASGREPSDVELETLAQTWSEHCSHKTFKAIVEYTEQRAGQIVAQQTIPGLLATFIRRVTEEIAAPWVKSAFIDNAGIIAFDERHELSFKVETHNHPSALEPFGGANTGVGGVLRDVIAVSARPIAATDVLCFAPATWPAADVPLGVLHPRRVAAGVVAGIQDYGNKFGVPTVSGAIYYDAGYLANPLVYCGAVGIAPNGSHPRAPQSGDAIVVLGGRTGRDGIGGATFSSLELTHETNEIAATAVQIGNPITEKKCLEAILQARDARLYTAITDCGAGGLSSAVGEMGAELGAQVYLDRVLLKYAGLAPWEIWLSEAQERMVLAVSLGNVPALLEICRIQDVEATVIGEFTATHRLVLYYGTILVGDLEMDFLHHGCPRRTLQAIWDRPAGDAYAAPPVVGDLGQALLDLLCQPSTASKEDVIRRYDHEVQGGTILKPLVGVGQDAPGDAPVIRPLDVPAGAWQGFALGCGFNPRYGLIDPWAMAHSALDEAVRNVVAVGADPDRIAVLDNFCWGDPNRPDRLGGLVRAAQGCYEAALLHRTPFISGKDSLNNEYLGADGARHPIPPSLLISALGLLPDVRRAVTMDFKAPGNLVYQLGLTRYELGGSIYYQQHGLLGERVPQPQDYSPALMRRLHQAMRQGLVQACHDCSEGGLAVAAAEMVLGGAIGLDLHLNRAPADDAARQDAAALLFAESNARFLVEVRPADAPAFEAIMAAGDETLPVGAVFNRTLNPVTPVIPFAQVGTTKVLPTLTAYGSAQRPLLELTQAALRHAWQGRSDHGAA
ncbi:MAG: phosphoribosylformylglycinamidine synthase subunit PurL [Chloroflexi bacterium]|nr:phosphoribosylformylglycinamidine synthase subunit PurL [Chloroflexota bacterium]